MSGFNRNDVMFLRNVIHGAPISPIKIASRLRDLDVRLGEGILADRQIPIRDFDWYLDVAIRTTRLREDA